MSDHCTLIAKEEVCVRKRTTREDPACDANEILIFVENLSDAQISTAQRVDNSKNHLSTAIYNIVR